jgi:hypothetical protein
MRNPHNTKITCSRTKDKIVKDTNSREFVQWDDDGAEVQKAKAKIIKKNASASLNCKLRKR